MGFQSSCSQGTSRATGSVSGVANSTVVLPFPGLTLPPKHCGDCVHAYLGNSGVYCAEYSEFINDETVAEQCESYER